MIRTATRALGAILSLSLLLSACDKPEAPKAADAPAAEKSPSKAAAQVDAARLTAAAKDGANWMSTGRTYDEQRHSPLDKINAGNVKQLGLAWHHDFDVV